MSVTTQNAPPMWLKGFAAAGVFTLLTGCSFNSNGSITTSRRMHQTIHVTYACDAAPSVRVTNVSGFVRVSGWSKPQIDLTAGKYGDNQSDLDNTVVTIDRDVHSFQAQTHYPSGGLQRRRGGVVEYTLHVPNGASVTVSDVSGDVELHRIAGAVDATTISGSIEADGLQSDARARATSGTIDLSMDRLGADQTLDVAVVSGSIRLALPQSANANVKASTISGSIQTPYKTIDVKQGPVGNAASGTIGSGGARVRLSAVSGTIAIERER